MLITSTRSYCRQGLSRRRKKWLAFTLLLSACIVAVTSLNALAQDSEPYQTLSDFGDNPGELSASIFNPNASKTAQDTSVDALVVLLHGCVQDGIELANDSGLTAKSREHGFAVLAVQQSYENNVKRCFNWFSSQDTQIDSGEMLSLKNMILTAKKQLNAKHIYLMGLSAGGAMASAALVNYPEMFDAGAVIAGLPYPCADNLTKAISCMKTGPSQTVPELVAAAQSLHPKVKHWPALVVLTGTNDQVVNATNSQKLAMQWATLTQASEHTQSNPSDEYHSRTWINTNQKTVISLIEINNMNHGIAVNPDIPDGGKEGDFLLKSPISAVVEIIKLWGLQAKKLA